MEAAGGDGPPLSPFAVGEPEGSPTGPYARFDCAACGRRWSTQVVMDEGFYDCAYGTCPEGHRRMLDD